MDTDTCVWRQKQDAAVCGAGASFYHSFMLCGQHQVAMALKTGATAVQSAKYHKLDSFPGWCYVVLMRDGYIKIGYSNTVENLNRRLGAGDLDPLVVLWILRGGFVSEAVLHKALAEHRVPGLGERFNCSVRMVGDALDQVCVSRSYFGGPFDSSNWHCFCEICNSPPPMPVQDSVDTPADNDVSTDSLDASVDDRKSLSEIVMDVMRSEADQQGCWTVSQPQMAKACGLKLHVLKSVLKDLIASDRIRKCDVIGTPYTYQLDAGERPQAV